MARSIRGLRLRGTLSTGWHEGLGAPAHRGEKFESSMTTPKILNVFTSFPFPRSLATQVCMTDIEI